MGSINLAQMAFTLAARAFHVRWVGVAMSSLRWQYLQQGEPHQQKHQLQNRVEFQASIVLRQAHISEMAKGRVGLSPRELHQQVIQLGLGEVEWVYP